jgi:hypothetical protein
MKTKFFLFLLVTAFQLQQDVFAQTAEKISIKADGIYECKEWKFTDGKIDNPEPAYYRFFPDSCLLFCHYEKPGSINKDSMDSPEVIFSTVLSKAMLEKMMDNVADDATNVYRVSGKYKITVYRYKILPNGICYDILSERPNCLGKPNLKVPNSTVIKSDNGDPADDRFFKFVPVN